MSQITGLPLPSWLGLPGMVAVVTGCGSHSGIGVATARHLAQLGARVVITATGDHIHDRVRELRSEGLEVNGIAADLTSEVRARSVLDFALATGGAPTILVNNAGMTSQGSVV